MKLKKGKKQNVAGAFGCAGVLGILAVAMLFPVSNEKADAVTYQQSGQVRATANVQSVLSIALDDSVDFEVTPTPTGVFTGKSADLTISTNNASGYNIFVNSGETNALKNVDPKITASVPAVASKVTQANFANNTWGVNIGTTEATDTSEYSPVSTGTTTTTPIFQKASPNGYDNLKLNVGTKIDTTLPSGQYMNTVTVSVVANPTDITSLTQLIYMQQMSPKICFNTPANTSDFRNPTTKKLIDLRDKKQYYVAKLADGNCWMTQNLDLNIAGTGGTQPVSDGVEITSELSDLTNNEAWTASSVGTDTDGQPKVTPETTSTAIPPKEEGTTPSQTGTGSWDFGQWVLAVPALAKSCGTEAHNISDCTNVGFVRVGEGTEYPSPTFQAKQGAYTLPDGTEVPETLSVTIQEQTKTTPNIVTVDKNTGSYDPHYLIGNYYQWNTATAGSGGNIVSKAAAESICPKNWQLPSSGDNTTNGTFGKMLNEYGLASTVIGTGGDGNEYNIASPPLSYVRSGYIPMEGDILRLSGTNGYGWSKRPAVSWGSYYLLFYYDRVIPSDRDHHYVAFPVRCMTIASSGTTTE